MKHHALCLLLLAVLATGLTASAQTTDFTYQGHLMDGGASANGSYDIQFTLKNAATDGTTVGSPQVVAPVSVVNGIFTVTLDFGAVFDGGERWVEAGVRPFGSMEAYTVLSPRQKLTSAPYAVRALSAASATNATNATSLTGPLNAGNIPANLITGAMLADNTITGSQIQNGAVGSTQLANNAVGADQLASGAITLPKIAATHASGFLGQSVLTGLPGSTVTATVTFPQPFSSAPPVMIQQAGWTLGTVTATGFSATVPFTRVAVETGAGGSSLGLHTSLAVVNGRPAISYQDSYSGGIKYAIAPNADGSGTWTFLTVESADYVGSYTSLAVVNGRPAISYHDITNADLKYAIAPTADGTSGAWTILTVDSVGDVGLYTSLAVVNGRPAISYRDTTNADLKFAIASSADGTGGAWTLLTVDSPGDVGRSTSLAVVNGRPAISYRDTTNADLKFAIAPNADGTGTWTTFTVDSTGDVGDDTSLAVVNGRPAISYRNTTNADLKYAIAPTPDGGGTWTTLTVDSAGGSYTSLAVVNGRPAIGYYVNGNKNTKYAIAPSADGTGGAWTTFTVDGSLEGGYTSLAVVNGRPAISYYDGENFSSTLKYAQLPDGLWTAGDTNAAAPVLAAGVQAGTVGSDQLAAGAVDDSKLATPKVNRAGDTMTGGLSVPSLGIGTSSPADRLHVAGGSLRLQSTGSNLAYILANGSTVTGELALPTGGGQYSTDAVAGDVVLRNSAGGKLLLQAGTAASTLSISTDSRVGIGTASPGARLHIKAPAANNRDNGIRLEHFGNNSRWNIHTDESANNLTFSFNDQYSGSNYSYLTSTQAGLISVSDRSTKKDIAPLAGALDQVVRLRPVSFRYKNAAEDSPPNYGFIAQEVEEVLPDLVLEHQGLKTLASNSLTAINTRAVQELNTKHEADVKALREENDTLRKESADLKARLERLEQMLEKGVTP
jgi:hypothetical protein